MTKKDNSEKAKKEREVSLMQRSIEINKIDFRNIPQLINVKGANFHGEHPKSNRPKADSPSERLIAEAIKNEYRYAMLGLILGISSIIGGIILGLNGVAGSTSWTASVLGLESKINDAAPGVVLFIVGLFFVFVTKPKVNMKDLQG